jgi:hypothetical protein
MTLEQVVHRIAIDSAFAAAFRADPEAALRQEGVSLERGEVLALAAAMKTSEPNNRPNAGWPWYESQLHRDPAKDPNAGWPWYEAQLGTRPV